MEIGKESLLYSECSRWDYVDRYRFAVADPGDRIGLSDLAEAFVGPGPRWVEGLFALRNRIVSVFGFKTPAAQGKNAAGHGGKWESGERVGIFEVLARSTDEIVLGDNDRHLDLRVSLLVERGGRDGREKTLSVTTAVRLNDRDKKNTDEQWLEQIALKDALDRLGERERHILALRFYEGKTQMEVSAEVGISQAQVSRLEKNALRTIRKNI